MWHDVPNRGRPLTISNMERGFGDVGLASAWQGDNASMRAELGTAVRPTMNAGGNHWLQVPVAKNPDGSPITGPVMGRIVNRSGPGRAAVDHTDQPLPYMPASLDTSKATLVTRDHESMEGVVTGETSIAGADWKFCGGGTFDAPVPLTKLPVQICLKGGFNPAKLYQVVYTAKDPYVLGIGFAAWRDIASFFKYADQDDVGTRESAGGSHFAQHHARPLAVRQLPAGLAASRFQSGRSEAHGARRHVAHHRGPPDRAELPLGATRTARSSSIRPAAKGRSGGCRTPIRYARPADARHP